jgi:hypothetical protein
MEIVTGSIAVKSRAGAVSARVAVATPSPLISRIRATPSGSGGTVSPEVGSRLGVAAGAAEDGEDRSAAFSEAQPESEAARTAAAAQMRARWQIVVFIAIRKPLPPAGGEFLMKGVLAGHPAAEP